MLLIKITTAYINVVFIQILPHWGTNQERGINRGNMVCGDMKYIYLHVCMHA